MPVARGKRASGARQRELPFGVATNQPQPPAAAASQASAASRASMEEWRAAPSPLPLDCDVQHYAWGQRGAGAYIPAFLGVPGAPALPYAELWIGDNPALPSRARLSDQVEVGLPLLLATAPDVLLSAGTRAAVPARLPFLTKILAADQALSIQVHPSASQAQAGFAEEDARGVPLRDERRNFKDRHHKPELLVALTPFWGLKGFRPLAQIASALRDEAPELSPLGPHLDQELAAAGDDPRARAAVLRALYTRAMRLPQAEVNALLEPLLARLGRTPGLGEADRGYWVLRAAHDHAREGAGDRGLFSFFLLNLVRLAPGQGIFLGPGEPHAYLQGVGLEVMANSDNVLRGGLTPKHVDIERLLDILVFADGPAHVIQPASPTGVYETPAAEFQVARLELGGAMIIARDGHHGADVWVVISGGIRLAWSGGARVLRRGVPVLVPAALGPYTLASADGTPALAFRAGERT